MITLRRNADRRHVQRGKQETWLTFWPNGRVGPVDDGFGDLVAFDELLLQAGETSLKIKGTGVEIITYVYGGVLAQEDSHGDSGVVHAGEFQRMVIGRGVRQMEKNPSRTETAHIFRIFLRPPEAGLGSVREQSRFPAAQRHNSLCVIASRDGQRGSLKLLQEALIYSSILDPGHHLVHELRLGRCAWLHVIRGEAVMQDLVLNQGDGVGITSEPSVSITAREDCEILLVDLGPTSRPFAGRAGQ